MSQEFTEKIFTRGEQGTGNEIIFETNRLAYASNTTKISLLRDLAPLGLFSINEGREVFNLAPVEGGDERIKTLNVVNADIIFRREKSKRRWRIASKIYSANLSIKQILVGNTR